MLDLRRVPLAVPRGVVAAIPAIAIALSVPATAAAASPPVNTALPTVSGSAVVGSTLTSTAGTWSGTTPITLTRDWMRCDTNGQNCIDEQWGGSSYLIGNLDLGKRVELKVTATDADGAQSAVSMPMAVVASTPTSTSPPPTDGSGPAPTEKSTAPCTRYVSTAGSDSNTGADTSHPVQTVARANALAKLGDVWCFSGGTYYTSTMLSTSGTSTAPITYRSLSGQTAILDGTGKGIGSSSGVVNVTGNYITIANFEIRNSGGRGLSVTGPTGITMTGNKIHDTQYAAVSMSGSNIAFTSNEVYNGAKSNQNGHFNGATCSTGGWPATVSTYYIWPNASNYSSNITISKNYIHDSWGEGIDVIDTKGGSVSGNTVENTWSVLLYLDGAPNYSIKSNYLAATNPAYNRCDNGNPPEGINMADEVAGEPVLANDTIVNNLVAGGTAHGINFWDAGSGTGYANLKIDNNTVWGTKYGAINLSSSPGSPGGEIKNNILFGSVYHGNGTWAVTNNDMPNGLSSGVSSTSNLTSNPSLVSPATGGAAGGFKVNVGSPAIAKGLSLATVTDDYFGSPRPSSATTLGFYEYN